jgi:hypothetical protein
MKTKEKMMQRKPCPLAGCKTGDKFYDTKRKESVTVVHSDSGGIELSNGVFYTSMSFPLWDTGQYVLESRYNYKFKSGDVIKDTKFNNLYFVLNEGETLELQEKGRSHSLFADDNNPNFTLVYRGD